MLLLKRPVGRNFNLYLFSDAHAGSALFYRKGFLKFVDTVRRDPIGLAIDLGDAIEAIMTDDKRYTDDTAKQPIPLKQANDYIEMIRPIKDKIIVRLMGNHEHKLHRFGNLAEYICHQLDIPYGTFTAKILFIDKSTERLMFKVFATHGFRTITNQAHDPIQKSANEKARLKRLLSEKCGDAILNCMGHTHKLIVAEPTKKLWLSDDGSQIRQRYTHSEGDFIHQDHRWFVNTGSFMKLYVEGISGYAELAGYDPTELGYAKVIVRKGEIQTIEKVIL